jgi:hypothetical protein
MDSRGRCGRGLCWLLLSSPLSQGTSSRSDFLCIQGHLQCKACGTIYNLQVNIDQFAIEGLNQFEIAPKDVFFKGLCPVCLKTIHQQKKGVEKRSKESYHKHVAGGGTSNKDWWPNQLNLKVLHQHSSLSNHMGEGFNHAEEFKKLDLKALEKDLYALEKIETYLPLIKRAP